MVNICLRRKGQPLDIGQGAGVALGKTLPISLTMADYISKRDKLLEKRRKLDAELKALEARAKQQERKDETRRKIIFGALVMNAATDDPRVMAWMRSLTASDMPAKDRALVDAWFEKHAPVEGTAIDGGAVSERGALSDSDRRMTSADQNGAPAPA